MRFGRHRLRTIHVATLDGATCAPIASIGDTVRPPSTSMKWRRSNATSRLGLYEIETLERGSIELPRYAPEPARGFPLMDRDAWDRDVADMVLRALPPAPARVLEVGCGEGRLARSMAAAGHRVVAIDPDAPQGPLFQPVSIEEYVASEPFDAAVATLSLHHIANLDAAVAKIAGLVIPGGTFVVVEFASDRLDEATAAWALEHLAPASEDGWLARRRNEWHAQDGGDDDSGFAVYLRRWAASENFHSATAMIDALRSHFREMRFERWPYLYPELQGVTREQEIAEIEEGRIQATGFSFVGLARS